MSNRYYGTDLINTFVITFVMATPAVSQTESVVLTVRDVIGTRATCLQPKNQLLTCTRSYIIS